MPTLAAIDIRGQLSDIQDNIIKPILMKFGRHIFLHFDDQERGRAWLQEMLKRVATAHTNFDNGDDPKDLSRFTVNFGLTFEGLKVLGLKQGSLNSFPEAFRLGARARAPFIGDLNLNSPEHWEGGLGSADIHAMAWVRTRTEESREEATRQLKEVMKQVGGVDIRFVQDTNALANQSGIGSEGAHFGFVDPISNPPIEGVGQPFYPGDGVLEDDGSWRPVKPGEFLLGYEDEAGREASFPEPEALRLNGTYLVFRKLHQDVAGFRRFLAEDSLSMYGENSEPNQEKVAAKLMGRWRSGCPLDLSPDHDDKEIAADPNRRNNFTYEGDPEGARCPLGAHLRRSNPRATPLKRLTAVRRHRVIRRGVEYGPLLANGVTTDDNVDRGLINMFINADIERQFEFVQREWMHSGEFIGLDPAEQDPFNGVGGEGSQFTNPGSKNPVSFDLPHFVLVKGGEYLFVPGIKALEGIANGQF